MAPFAFPPATFHRISVGIGQLPGTIQPHGDSFDLLAQDATVEDVEPVQHIREGFSEPLLRVPHVWGVLETGVLLSPAMGAQRESYIFHSGAAFGGHAPALVFPGVAGRHHAPLYEGRVFQGLIHGGEVIGGPWHCGDLCCVSAVLLYELVNVLYDPVPGWLPSSPPVQVLAPQERHRMCISNGKDSPYVCNA